MMKIILISIGVLALSISVIAGGDDRDRGPVELLDAMVPDVMALSTGKSIGNQELKTMKLTVGSKAVSVRAHIACQAKVGLSESNIAIFRKVKSSGYLYNTGPIESLGTIFSPKRWDAYFDCVDRHDD